MATKEHMEGLADMLVDAAQALYKGDVETASETVREARRYARQHDIPFRTVDFIDPGEFPTREEWEKMERDEQRELCDKRGWYYSDSCTDLYYSDIVERAMGLHN